MRKNGLRTLIALVLMISLCMGTVEYGYAAEELQKAMFPLKGNINMGQPTIGLVNDYGGQGQLYSHTGNTGTPQIAIDASGVGVKAYAPFDAKIVAKGSYIEGNWVVLESVKEVLWGTDGGQTTGYMHMLFVHDDDVSDLTIGKYLPQGVHFYTSGNAGDSTGTHIHLEVAAGKYNGMLKYTWIDVNNGNVPKGGAYLNNTIDPAKHLFFEKTTKFNGTYYCTDIKEYSASKLQVQVGHPHE